MMHWSYGMGYGDMLFMSLGGLVFLILLGAGVVILVRSLTGQPSAPAGAGMVPPRQVLADRYARGEIDQDEYLRRLRVLDSPPPAKPGG